MQTTRQPPGVDHDQTFLDWLRTELAARGEAVVRVESMASAASYRRFVRVSTDKGTWVAIDSPPERENNRQFERLAIHFGAAGVPVPRVVAHDVAAGRLLVTDLGTTHLGDVYGTADESAAITRALEVLVRLQSLPEDEQLLPLYTRDRMHDEFELCPTWLLRGLLGIRIGPAQRALLDAARELLIDTMCSQPRCCVHRDYHSRNLLWHDGELGVVDFQDALWGPMSYDLASLLRDCYHRFAESDIVRWRRHYSILARQAGLPQYTASSEFARALDRTAIQRQIKAVGIFARLELRDRRDIHLRDILPVLEHIVAVSATDRELVRLSDWFASDVLPAARAQIGHQPS